MSVYSICSVYLKLYVIPSLIGVGIILNMASFSVLKSYKSSSIAQYMSFLGLIETFVLIIGAISLYSFNTVSFITVFGCKSTLFLYYSLADYSVYIIIIMTFERFYGVWRPFQSNKMNNNNKNLIISCLFCCLINCHFLFTHSLVFDDYNHLGSNETMHKNVTKMITIIEQQQHNTQTQRERLCCDTYGERIQI
jgi:hypothetical protein